MPSGPVGASLGRVRPRIGRVGGAAGRSATGDRSARGRSRRGVGRPAPARRRAGTGTARSGPTSSSWVPTSMTRPVVDHRDLVGQRQRGPAVRDQDRGPVGGDPAQRGVDRRLGDRVDGAGRVVQHQHPRVGDQRPGQRQPLPLAAGQGQPALADHRGVAVGQRLDEVGRLGRPPRRPGSPRRWRPGGRSRCWRRWCRRTGTPPRTPPRPRCAGRPSPASRTSTPPTRTVPGLRVVEPGQQQRHGRLPGPGRADQRDGRTRRGTCRSNDAQHRVLRRVAEPDAGELARPADRPGAGSGSAALGDLRQRVDDLQHPLDRRPGLLAEDQQHGQHPGRRDQLGQVEREGQERAERDRAVQRQVAAEGEHADLAEGGQRLQRRG